MQEVVLLRISKLNESAPDKKQGDLTQFSPKKDFRKRKMDLISPTIFISAPNDGLCYRVIDSSILKELFSSQSKLEIKFEIR